MIKSKICVRAPLSLDLNGNIKVLAAASRHEVQPHPRYKEGKREVFLVGFFEDLGEALENSLEAVRRVQLNEKDYELMYYNVLAMVIDSRVQSEDEIKLTKAAVRGGLVNETKP